MRLRAGHALLQRHEHVAGPAQHDAIIAGRLKLVAQLRRGRQRDVLLIGARIADRAGVLAAMAGVQHHQRRRRPGTGYRRRLAPRGQQLPRPGGGFRRRGLRHGGMQQAG
jgi:hypothetical protein